MTSSVDVADGSHWLGAPGCSLLYWPTQTQYPADLGKDVFAQNTNRAVVSLPRAQIVLLFLSPKHKPCRGVIAQSTSDVPRCLCPKYKRATVSLPKAQTVPRCLCPKHRPCRGGERSSCHAVIATLPEH